MKQKLDKTTVLSTLAFVVVMGLYLVPANADAATVEAPKTCRSASVKHKFDVANGYPHGRPGHKVDHICALEQNGIDAISNMQYQTYAESDAKDRIERTPAGKALFCNPSNSTPTRQVFNCRSKKK